MYKYNLPVTREEDWFFPEVWPHIQEVDANFKSFPFSDDDVIICTYPRSGTHMPWLLVRYLLQGSTDPIKDPMEDSHLPISSPTNRKQTRKRALNTHYLPAHFGDDFFKKGRNKFIHVSLNPKDALASFYHMMDMIRKTVVIIPDSWDEFLRFVLATDIKQISWFNTMRAWEEFLDRYPEAPVLNPKFEEILRDSVTAIKTISVFIEVPLSDRLLADMLIACKFENTKDSPVAESVKRLMGPYARNV